MRKLPWLVLFICITSCTSMSDYNVQLSGGYQLQSESGTDKIIICKMYTEGDKYIPCNVVAYAYNNKFIIAKQQRTDKCFSGSLGYDIDYGNTEYHYWIICHTDSNKDCNSQFYGPLSENDYLQQKQKLGVPDKLQFSF